MTTKELRVGDVFRCESGLWGIYGQPLVFRRRADAVHDAKGFKEQLAKKQATEELVAFVRSLVMPRDEEPEEEDYDDTESAYGNGYEVQRWEISQRARALLKKLKIRAEV
jgi:hypothetical protein